MAPDALTRRSLPHASFVRWLHESSSHGIFTTDLTLTVLSWNRWLERATGHTETEIVGKRLFEFFPDLPARGLDRYYDAALRGEPSVLAQRFHQHLLRIETAGRTMPQSSRIAPLLVDDAVVGTVTVVEDVTERVTHETELRRQIAALDQARQTAERALRAKDEFLATLSHELRTPLNAVLGWTRILQSGNVDAATIERALHVIDRNVVAQARLIDDMLDMSRVVAGKLRLEMAPADLTACTLAAIDVVTPAATAKNITLERTLPATPIPITADADRIQQVIWNVLANAVKFTPRGGRIDVRVDDEPGTARVTVIDSGKGIAPEFLPYVFDRFSQANSTASRSEGGLGLGLALARQLIELHGGEIDVHSDGVGKGSTFTISLPSQLEVANQRTRQDTTRTDLQGTCVLLVEDAADWAEVLSKSLESCGARVLVASSAREALAHVERERPDAIIADIGLPGEDGYEMLRQMRARHPDTARIPALALTAYAGPQYRDRALSAGYDVYRAKPIAPMEVVGEVARAVRRDKPPGNAR